MNFQEILALIERNRRRLDQVPTPGGQMEPGAGPPGLSELQELPEPTEDDMDKFKKFHGK
jgi:hypothetical protein